ncbi:MAG TPA: porin [Vicinamibacterales bacterium]|nr:porin [Vicinamibacterales bacterium]
MSAMMKTFVGLAAAAAVAIVPATARAQTVSGSTAQTPSAAAPAPAPDSPAPPPPPPADPKSDLATFFHGTEIGGLIDAHYDWFSTKTDGDAPYRNFDTRHDQFRVSMAQIWITKTPTADSRAGFKAKLSVGPATTIVQSLEPGGSPAVLQNVEEGFISYLAPLGKGVQVDVGKFVTQHGAEVIEAKDNWNYSRSLLFALAIPYYHSGVRATYSPNAKVTLMGTVVNGWNNVVENNSAKTVGAQVAYKPTAALSLVQNYMTGPEQTNDNHDWRQLSDSTATLTVNPMLSLMTNYDYGTDVVAGARVRWQGVAGYARIQGKRIAFSPRLEWYDDPSGFTTGTTQTLKEVTTTLELKATDTFLWRIEYRSDLSDAAVFKTHAGDFKKTQSSIGFAVLYSFSTKG